MRKLLAALIPLSMAALASGCVTTDGGYYGSRTYSNYGYGTSSTGTVLVRDNRCASGFSDAWGYCANYGYGTYPYRTGYGYAPYPYTYGYPSYGHPRPPVRPPVRPPRPDRNDSPRPPTESRRDERKPGWRDLDNIRRPQAKADILNTPSAEKAKPIEP